MATLIRSAGSLMVDAAWCTASMMTRTPHWYKA